MIPILNERYEIVQPLSKKTGRQTFLARDLKTQTLVVLKLLKFGSDFEWEQLKLFEREAKTLQNLFHPAIPGYLDSFELDLPNCKGFALVQTFIEAKSLEEHLKNGRTFSEAEVKQLAQALLEILIYLHGRSPSIIHRDLKPSNILLTNRSGHSFGQVYLVDFGSVQNLVATEGGTITVVGTYGYMPPEQFGGRAVPASDLYSLGATLVYLVTGMHPADLPQHNLQIQFRDRVSLNPGFVSWIEILTKPTVEERFDTAQKALQSLEQSSSGLVGLVTTVRHGTLSGRENIRPILMITTKSNDELEITNKLHIEVKDKRHTSKFSQMFNICFIIYLVAAIALLTVGLTLAFGALVTIALVSVLYVILFIIFISKAQFHSI